MSNLVHYVRQIRPRTESYTPHVDRIQDLFINETVAKLPQEKEIDVASLVSAENSSISTQMYEAAGVIVGMQGLKLTGADLKKVMSHDQFSPKAKTWIEDFLNVHPNKEALDALLNWIVFIGGAVADVHNGFFKDFIHKDVDKEYKGKSPTTFGVPTGEKDNTADVVLITYGTRQGVFNAFSTISKLSDKDQSSRVKTTKKGLITLLDDKGKEIVSFYQVSLKKAMENARIGRITSFVNQNFAGGSSLASPTQAFDFAKSSEELNMAEGFFGDALSKFKDVISGGIKNFVGWVKKKYTKVAQVLVGVAVKLSNQKIKRNRGMKSISNILNMTQLNESSLTSFLGEKKSPYIEVTDKLLTEFKTMEKELIKNDEINKTHEQNVTLLEKLNASYAVPDRKVTPILMLPNNNAGIVDMVAIGNEIREVLKSKKGDKLTKDEIYVALKVGMNYSANVAIFSILQSIERNISQYENLSQSLFAFSSEIESEAKFGNTSLPLVIVYGGEDKKSIVLGTRGDYKKDKTNALSNIGRDYDDFPIAIISVKKSKSGKSGKGDQLYNVVQFKIVTDFKEVDGKPPEPMYLMFELITEQSRSFTLKIEGNKIQDKIKAMK
jgi:hypothetical protein